MPSKEKKKIKPSKKKRKNSTPAKKKPKKKTTKIAIVKIYSNNF